MAIDADRNAGSIDEREARMRRAKIAQEAKFYAAMDGAARFSQRDALATILIAAINILAGFPIGVFQLNIPLRNSPARFHLRRQLEPFLPRVVVLSPTEIPPGIFVQSLGVVR